MLKNPVLTFLAETISRPLSVLGGAAQHDAAPAPTDPNDGASQPVAAQPEEAPAPADPNDGAIQPVGTFVASVQDIAARVKETVLTRERWLTSQRLPLNTRMDDAQIQRFLHDVKEEFGQQDFSNRRGRDETAARVLRSSRGGPFCARPPGDGGVFLTRPLHPP